VTVRRHAGGVAGSLLLKAKQPRPKDEADFAAFLPRLDEPARRWLADALSLLHPGHPWLARARPAAH
jgi:hypothetical protein